MSSSTGSKRLHYRTCNICEAMCGMVVTVQDGRIGEIRGDREDVLSRGHLCPKGPAMREVYEDPDRLRQPMRRTAKGWQAVGWTEALDEAAARLGAIQRRDGHDAVGLYVGNPIAHHHGAALMLQGLRTGLRTRNSFDANSQDANPKLFACMLMYGDLTAVTVPDVDRTDFFLILGANPAASNGSIMSMGDVRGRLAAVRARGARMVLIDPRRTETAQYCDEHHFIRPGSDAALLLAMLQVLFVEGRIDQPGVERQAHGLGMLREVALRVSPERAAQATGIEAAVIRRLARQFSEAKSAVAYGRVGTCQHPFGPATSWLIDALNVVTGNFDRAGGAMFTNPAVDVTPLARLLVGNSYDKWRSRVRGLPEFAGALPSAVIAEEMDTPGPGQIRGFVTLAGNPVLSTPNGGRLDRALAQLEFMVSIDYYLNETTRHAHLVLPGLHALERGHYDLLLHLLTVRNTVKYSEPVVPPAEGALDDWEIIYELGMRLGGLGLGNPVVDRLAHWAWRGGLRVTPDRVVDLILRLGEYGDRFLPVGWGGRPGLNLDKVRAAPHGIDLGPLRPNRKKRVATSDGRVELAPARLIADVPRLEAWIDEQSAPAQVETLLLIGRRHLRTNNSWMHNLHSLTKGPDRSQLLIHPDDARRLGLDDGSLVRVQSRVGQVTARLRTSDDMMPGVVSLPHGYGHQSSADTQRIAGRLFGPNINAITDDALVEPLVGTAILNGVPVTVTPQEPPS